MAWRDEAACRGKPPEWWHIERGGNYTEARKVCTTCTVRGECLEDIMDYEANVLWGLRFGMYAGLSPEQRGELEDARRNGHQTGELPPVPQRPPRIPPPPKSPPPPYSTDAGYQRHWRWEEPPCRACQAAHNLAALERLDDPKRRAARNARKRARRAYQRAQREAQREAMAS
jgi:hypothetical protein